MTVQLTRVTRWSLILGSIGCAILLGTGEGKVAAAKDNDGKGGCWVIMYEHDDFTRGKIRFEGPLNVPRMDAHALDNGKSAGDEIDSLVVGPNAWLEVYEDENYDDTCRRFGPGSKVKSLDAHGIGDNIDSFRLYNAKPEGWE